MKELSGFFVELNDLKPDPKPIKTLVFHSDPKLFEKSCGIPDWKVSAGGAKGY